MKDFLIGFIGFIIGGLHGIVLMCMMQVAKKSDEATTTFI